MYQPKPLMSGFLVTGVLISGLVISALLGSMGKASAEATPAGGQGTLTIGISQFPSTLHPNIDSMLAKSYVGYMTRRPFTTYGHDWQLTCMLCTELPTFENKRAEPYELADGSQGVKLTFTIRPDATWGDGVPVTTEDVVFTWEVGRHPMTGVSNFELYRRIEKIEVLDARTFTMFVSKLTYTYNSIGDFEPIPAHLERAAFADPASYKTRTTYVTDPTNPGLYFGPYRIARHVPGSEIELVPNSTWWGGVPAFSRILVRTITNTSALEANLLSGEIDMIAGELGLVIDQALAFEERNGDRFQILYQPGLIYEHIDLRLDNPILADQRVRQAMLYAIDRTALSEQLFASKQLPADSSVNPLDWVADPDVPSYAYDPKMAEKLLDEAGWSTKRRGIRHNAAGEPFQLEFVTTAGDRTRELVQQVLQSYWKQVGLDIRIKNQPARVYFGETLTKRQFTGLAMYAWLSAPESVPRTSLHSEQIPSEENGWGGQNYTGYRNPEMDSLIDRIEVELDRDRRKVLWAELQAIYARDLPALPLYFRTQSFVLPKWLSGVRPTGHQFPSTMWVEEWTVSR